MMKVINYIYTGLYRLLLKTGDKEIAEYSALFLVSLGLTLNLFVLLRILNFDPKEFMTNRVFGFFVFILLLTGSYFYFVHTGRHKKLLENSRKWTTRNTSISVIVSIFFCIESILAPVLYSLIEDGIF